MIPKRFKKTSKSFILLTINGFGCFTKIVKISGPQSKTKNPVDR